MKNQGKVCTKCGVWKPLEEFSKKKNTKDGRQYECRECQKEQRKQWYENNPNYNKQWRENNPGYHNSEQRKQYREVNKEKKKEYDKQYHKDNAEHRKQYYKDNIEKIKEYDKQRYQDNIENNLQYISSIVDQIRPIFKELSLPVYGYIYKFENIKTGHVYIGQTTYPLKMRYGFEGGIIKSWIKERKIKSNQKFKNELLEEDFVVTEMLDVACCQYHLNALEVYYIDKYDSCENGYNNTIGNHKTDDGLEEFIEILQQHNLEFVDGQIVKKIN